MSCWNFSNSFWYLGLNAFSTLVSPSKSQESVNIYKRFIVNISLDDEHPLFEKAKQVLSKPFLGFSSNRFGRLAELSTLFLDHRPLLFAFFDKVVDENQNKLQLACSCYLKSEWFRVCCEIINYLDNLFPLIWNR